MEAFHITWVTHGSRISERMIQYRRSLPASLRLDQPAEVEITRYILNIVREDHLRILAYNICCDHIHLLLICNDDQKSNIVRKLKGKSAQLYKDQHSISTEFHLWAQKYSYTYIDDWSKFHNTIEYIESNRENHSLPCNKGLQPLVTEMLTAPSAVTDLDLW